MKPPERNLLDLPPELIPQYALNLNLREIFQLCSVNKKFSELYSNEHFWKMKLIHDYHSTPNYTGSWRRLYLNYNSPRTFGNNFNGQLGLGDNEERLDPTIIPLCKAKIISAGRNHTLLIDLEDNLWGFGRNASGQLGLGDRKDRTIPTLVPGPESSSAPRKFELRSTFARLSFKAKTVAAGESHTIVIDSNDNVWSFGDNDYGQLGLGDNQNRLTPTLVKADKSRAELDLLELRSDFNRPSVDPGIKAKAVSAGRDHTLLIDLNDNLLSFGLNNKGQLGLGDTENRSSPTPGIMVESVSAGGDHSLLIDLDNNVWSFGSNNVGQLGLGDRQYRVTPTQIVGLKAKCIAAGRYHTLVIDLEDNLWEFGLDVSSRFRSRDIRFRLTPTLVPWIKAKTVAAGDYHTIVIDLNDNLLVFGQNTDGQLGLGDHQPRSTLTPIPRLKAKAVSAGGDYTVVIGTNQFDI